MTRIGLLRTISLTTGGVLLLAGTPARAAEPIERFTAFAVDMSAQAGRNRTGTVDIAINRWSTDQERNRLRDALREKGPESLLSALQGVKEPVGYIQTPGNIGYPLRFARQIPLAGGGRRILLGTDRPISFIEAMNPSITSDYPFMIIDLTVDASGKGQGRLMPLAKVTANDDHVIDIENYTTEPVRLNVVRKVK
jgi:hypothetical protein